MVLLRVDLTYRLKGRGGSRWDDAAAGAGVATGSSTLTLRVDEKRRPVEGVVVANGLHKDEERRTQVRLDICECRGASQNLLT